MDLIVQKYTKKLSFCKKKLFIFIFATFCRNLRSRVSTRIPGYVLGPEFFSISNYGKGSGNPKFRNDFLRSKPEISGTLFCNFGKLRFTILKELIRNIQGLLMIFIKRGGFFLIHPRPKNFSL